MKVLISLLAIVFATAGCTSSKIAQNNSKAGNETNTVQSTAAGEAPIAEEVQAADGGGLSNTPPKTTETNVKSYNAQYLQESTLNTEEDK